MRKKNTSYTFFRQYTSAILIFLLFISQTIHVSFFDRASADTDDYRDVVSIIIDDETYDALGGKVRTYANDIQEYLKNTRVSIIVTTGDTPPEVIAAKNEKLYYEGDGEDGVSRLVGTVLIGNIPLPIVHKEGISFPSLYPYVDFEDKSFVYSERSDIYEYAPDAPSTTEVDIWHGVMNPALGREWDKQSDIPKIGRLLDKTHDFYEKREKFAPSTTPPRVFYYDGYAESRSVDARSFYKYALFLQNTENLVYRRFTKYLLRDISTALRQYSQSSRGEEDDYLNNLAGFEDIQLGDDTLTDDTIAVLPDIQTARPIGKYLQKFHETLSEKTLGDIQKFVHNAGRYNSGITVRVDQGALQMSLMDEVAMRTIKEANDGLEKAIDAKIRETNSARKAILFDGLERHIVGSGVTAAANTVVGQIIRGLNLFGDSNAGVAPSILPENLLYTKPYAGYFFGQKTGNITSPNQCTIARGNNELPSSSTFGRSVLVEANIAYDVKGVESQVNLLTNDTRALVPTYSACFTNTGGAKIQSYWGGNSILRIAANQSAITSVFQDLPSGTSLSGYSMPILSLGGMKETKRLTPPTLANCLAGNSYEYGLLQPYSYPVTIEGNNNDRTEMRQWPEELGRFTCLTQHVELDESIRSFAMSIEDYEKTACLQGGLILDGKYFDGTLMTPTPTLLGSSCKLGGSESTEPVDNTRYEDRYYHTIDSLMKHVSPTEAELQAALSNGATPSLAVDVIRSLEFLTPKGNIAKFTYPNLFIAPATDIASMRTWLKTLSESEWNAVISRENSTTLSSYDTTVKNLIGASALPTSPLDWNTLISDDLILQVLRARNWLNPDVTRKYQSLVETNLSYSHEYSINNPKNPPIIPRSGSGYDIAYLGLTPFIPKGEQADATDEMGEYNQRIAALDGLNFSENEPGDENPNNKESAKCGPPEGVPLFQWPQAIVCWIQSLLPPKIIAGSCGASTLGLPESPAGLSGTTPLPPLAGDCSSIEFYPVSNTIIAGSSSVGVLRLLDATGKPMSPNLHDVTITADGGYLLDRDGQRVSTMTLSVIEPEQVFSYGSDTPGSMTLRISLDGDVTPITTTIRIIDTAQVKIIPSTPMKVGGEKVSLILELRDGNNTLLTGFDSVVSFDIADGVGSFSGEVFDIKDGKTENIYFTPGRLAGEQKIALDIPGLGYITDVPFTILPGDPFYIDGRVTDTTLEFALRDRYGNLTSVTMTGTVKKNTDPAQNISFTSGKFTINPKSPGYWRVDVPTLSNIVLSYRDSENSQNLTTGEVTTTEREYTMGGIPFYVIHVREEVGKYDFLPDYNARYTVLAGDSYLREGEDILYDTLPGASQSLAVSTVLTSPYERSPIFSIFPGGGYTISQSADTALESGITVGQGSLILDIYDNVSRARVARVGYPMRDTQVALSLSDQSDYTLSTSGNTRSLMKNTTTKLRFTEDQGVTLSPGVKLIPIENKSLGFLTLAIVDNGTTIGEITLTTDREKSLDVAANLTNLTTLTLESTHLYTRIDAYSKTYDTRSRGYSIVKNMNTDILEERMIGQNSIDSIGSLREVPGVGWHDNNRSLLSYAAGDTVGEATRWSHSYTLVNLGDPVTHVDQGAPGTELEGIDRTIGTQISGGVHGSASSYARRDMDGDGDQDIVIVYDDGFLELLQNISGKFRRKQMIAYLPSTGDRGIELGDFTGDRYADILSVDKEGKFSLVDNNLRRLLPKEIRLEDNLAAPVGVTQYKIYDMDADRRDDIVYLTEGGELAILYGTTTPGVFTKKILESNLGIRLSGASEKSGGAIRATTTPSALPVSPETTPPTPDVGTLNDEVFYERATPRAPIASPPPITTETDDEVSTTLANEEVINAISSTVLTDPNTSPSNPLSSPEGESDIYVRSEYASAYGLEIERKYTNTSSDVIHSGDKIEATITIKNTGSSSAQAVEYLDTIPKIFDASETTRYRMTLSSGRSEQKDFIYLPTEEFDAYFVLGDIPRGATLTITYDLLALPASYGEMLVDNLEKGLIGDDIYGDVGFDTSNTCGADILLWASDNDIFRKYDRGTRSFGLADLPPSLVDRLTDVSPQNGIPDSVENMNTGALNDAYNDMGDGTSLLQNTTLFTSTYDPSGRLASLGFSPTATQDIESMVQGLANGLACGFGGGSCISSPINWAPLAPGGSLSVLGIPVNPFGMTPNVGIPIFSGLTGIQAYCGVSTCCIPTVYPSSPLAFVPGPVCGIPSAGGSLGTWAPTNFIRVYVTPTLTLGVGAAVCLGGTAMTTGTNPLFPLMPTGNCIVAATSLPVCKGDGSSDDGNVALVSGLGTSTDAWNGASCSLTARTRNEADDASLTSEIITYLKNPTPVRLSSVYTGLSSRGGRGITGGPLLTLGDGQSGDTSIEISIDSAKPFNLGNIIKVKNRRISGFPEFIMDWVARQTDEITNKLLTPPSLVIIPPRTFGQNVTLDGSFSDFLGKFSKDRMEKGYEEFKKQVAGAGNVNVTDAFNKRTTGNTSASSTYNNWLDKKVSENSSTINRVAGGASQMKAAYQFIGQLPFIRIEQEVIPINIPWILPQELDRYSRALESYKSEIENVKGSWCVGKTPAECIDQHANLGLGALTSSIEANLKRLEEYKRFPEKIQKYLTWKERYIAQLLCNVDSLEQLLGGWYRDNGIRFRKWAEFYVLLKAIVSSWQPLLDLFKIKDEECGVCRNERWDLKYFKFKLLSAVIPQLPILQFPKWPDIVLDLSDIRLGIAIKVPDFRFNVNPIRLPDLPSLSLPRLPNVNINLPSIPVLPAIPPLPDLPDLPSLPKIALPSLPPPPKLPKLFGAVASALNILKLFMKIYCFYQKTPLVPEDTVGTIIAQRTDRQGTLSFDFLSIKFPQISIPSIKEIRVSTHVNLELKSDFIAEFAKSAVRPLNQFGADLGRGIPKKIGPDINVELPANINLNPQSSLDTLVDARGPSLLESLLGEALAEIEKDRDTMLDIEDFVPYFRSQLALAGQDTRTLDRALSKARLESDALTRNMKEESKKGFSLLREYLHTESAENKKLQKTLDNLGGTSLSILSDASLPRAALISQPPDLSREALTRYTAWQDSEKASLALPLVPDYESERLVASLQGQVKRLAALSDTSSPSLSSPNTAAGYSPNYEGIYILTPISKTQTRLFDYTDLIAPSDRVDVYDIDSDGDEDYIFFLGGRLYIKYAHRSEPQRSTDTSINREDIDSMSLPIAPDFFHESVSSPGKMEVSFSPADAREKSFRLEFFDRYIEWDRVTIDGKDSSDTPRTVIDMTTTAEISRSDGIEVTPVERYLKKVYDTSSFILEGQQVNVLPAGQPFSLSAGRALYTGVRGASLLYSSGSSTVGLSLEASRRYVFPFALSGSVQSEKIYVLSPSGGEKLQYSPDMIGMPLLPETRILSAGKVDIYDQIGGNLQSLPAGTLYRQISLGAPSDSYRVSFPYPNGFYSARLYTPSGELVRAGVTLIAPQASLDSSPPVVDLGKNIRIPVYQSKSIDLSDVITETSSYSIEIDADITVDSDGNGIYDDDFASQGTGFLLSNSTLTFGPFDTLGSRFMNMRVTDLYGNSTLGILQLDVYAPIPQIRSVSSLGFLTGALDEALSLEPIHFFRIRQGDALAKLFPEKTLTKADGSFATGSLFIGSGATLSYSGGTLRIDERNGLPTTSSISTRFLPATGTDSMRIVFSRSGKNILTENIVPPEIIRLVTTPLSLDSLSLPSVMIVGETGYSTVPAGLSDPSIPGGIYITDSAKKPVFTLDVRGQMYTVLAGLQFEIVPAKYLTIVVKNGTTKIATITYKVDFFYTAK